jgi:hypothetical protein
MVQLSATRWSCIAILWVNLVSFVAITRCVAFQRVIPKVSAYFVTTQSGNFWIPRILYHRQIFCRTSSFLENRGSSIWMSCKHGLYVTDMNQTALSRQRFVHASNAKLHENPFWDLPYIVSSHFDFGLVRLILREILYQRLCEFLRTYIFESFDGFWWNSVAGTSITWALPCLGSFHFNSF